MTDPIITELPELDERQLSRSPLELVVCQIRFENTLRVSDPRVADAFHEALGGRAGDYPEINQQIGAELNLAMGPGAPAVTQGSQMAGWRITSKDGTWAIALMPDHVAVETSGYETWSGDFRERLAAVLSVTAEYVEPATERRLGLRYVDRLAGLEVEQPADWAKWIQEPLLGPLLHDQLGPGIRAARQHLLINVAEEIQCGLAHGFLVEPEENRPVYLLDYDLYREDPRPFDTDAILEAADELNSYALRLFHASVKPELLEELR